MDPQRWAKWLSHLVSTERLEGVRWTVVEEERVSGVSRQTLHALMAGEKKRLSSRVVTGLTRLARKAHDDRLPAELHAGDAAVIGGAQTGGTTRPGADPGTTAATGRHRGVVREVSSERIVAMVANAVAAVIRDAINRNELEGTTAGMDAIVRGLQRFAECVEDSGADASQLYKVALKLQRGEL